MKKYYSIFKYLCALFFLLNHWLCALVPPPQIQQIAAPVTVLPGITPAPVLPGIVSAPTAVPAPVIQSVSIPQPQVQPSAIQPNPMPVQQPVAAPQFAAPAMQVPVFAQPMVPMVPQVPNGLPVPSAPLPPLVMQPSIPTLGEVVIPPAFPAIAQEEPVKAIDSLALQNFTEGTKVVLLFAGGGDKETRLLKITRGIYVTPTGKDPFDPKCQFVVMRKGNWIGFKSEYLKGRTLQSDSKSFVVHFPNSDFSDDAHKAAHWSAQFVNAQEVTSVVHLQNRATQGFLNFPYDAWAESLAWTSLQKQVPATIPGKLGDLKIIKISELPKEIAKTSGGKEYVYSPRLHKKFTPVYNDNWKFETPGKGFIIFDVQAKGNSVVSISTVADNLANNMYYLTLGDKKNSCITIRKSIDGPIFSKKDIRPDISQPSEQMSKSKKMVQSYWIKVDDGKISCGSGRVLGEKELITWQDPDKPLKVQFVGFAGGNSQVNFMNIELGGKEKIAQTAVLPPAFSQEVGTLQRVAVGSRKGNLDVWGIGLDGGLWHWKLGSMAANPWEKQTIRVADGTSLASVDDISLSSKGDLFVVSKGRAFRYDGEKDRWNEFDTGMQRLNIVRLSGHEGNIWAVADDGAAYQLVKRSWQPRSDKKSSSRIKVSPDNEVFVLNQAGKVFKYKGNNQWSKISGNVVFKDFFVVNKELIFGIDRHQRLWQFTQASGWAAVAALDKKQASGIISGAANAAGTIVVIDSKNHLYKLRNDGVPEKKIQQMMMQKAPALTAVKKNAVKKIKKSRKSKKAKVIGKKKQALKKKKKMKKASGKIN